MTFWLKSWLSFILNFVINFNPFGINAHTLIECYVRCDWLLPMICQNTDAWLTSRQTCFLCFVQHSPWFWKCLWDSFGLKQVKASVTSVTHLLAAHVPLFCFYHILRLSAIYYWTDVRRLFNRICRENTLVFVISHNFFSWLCINTVTLSWENWYWSLSEPEGLCLVT